MIAHVDTKQNCSLIEVHDSGPGHSQWKNSRPSLSRSYSTKAEGSGLGLWIVQQIVMAHGGVVVAANAPAGGAVFAVHLPLRKETITYE